MLQYSLQSLSLVHPILRLYASEHVSTYVRNYGKTHVRISVDGFENECQDLEYVPVIHSKNMSQYMSELVSVCQQIPSDYLSD